MWNVSWWYLWVIYLNSRKIKADLKLCRKKKKWKEYKINFIWYRDRKIWNKNIVEKKFHLLESHVVICNLIFWHKFNTHNKFLCVSLSLSRPIELFKCVSLYSYYYTKRKWFLALLLFLLVLWLNFSGKIDFWIWFELPISFTKFWLRCQTFMFCILFHSCQNVHAHTTVERTIERRQK